MVSRITATRGRRLAEQEQRDRDRGAVVVDDRRRVAAPQHLAVHPIDADCLAFCKAQLAGQVGLPGEVLAVNRRNLTPVIEEIFVDALDQAGDERVMELPERLPYRLLTGTDTREFCEKVSTALLDGYVLHGGPAVTFDGEKMLTAQAVVLP